MSRRVTQRDSSIQDEVIHDAQEKKLKNRRPANTAFRQQRLKAWQPILTPKTVLPLFFVLGVIFAVIGGLLFYASSQVQEISIDYSTCVQDAPRTDEPTSPMNGGEIPSGKYMPNFKTSTDQGALPLWRTYRKNITYSRGIPSEDPNVPGGVTIPGDRCQIQFEIPNQIGPPVFLYYRLTNFFQNHRRYVKSLDTNQLLGQSVPNSTISGGSCDPLRLNSDNKTYYPCGLIANSLFNDSFQAPRGITAKSNFSMTNTNIAWSSDKNLYGKTSYTPRDIAVPPNWQPRWGADGYTEENPPPDLSTYEAFQVWMRTAGLPTFSKLALRNDNDVMSNGVYQVDVLSNFPVVSYGGTKEIVISTATVMGGRNSFLGIAYVVVGGLCILLGVVFSVTQLVKPRKLGDHSYLSWNNEQPSVAAASGRRAGNDAA